ncbi:hypothetical protein EVAR_41800_1 [Eumeta japonica]|uniref:Uncharacterized protein n=1 Tax=Eumeta variegata TaxID=151549 RepID=A0A4C1VYR4_EUMVA|nr:hypothetical protein EVAR_41800_1 [Eumeta japonica]
MGGPRARRKWKPLKYHLCYTNAFPLIYLHVTSWRRRRQTEHGGEGRSSVSFLGPGAAGGGRNYALALSSLLIKAPTCLPTFSGAARRDAARRCTRRRRRRRRRFSTPESERFPSDEKQGVKDLECCLKRTTKLHPMVSIKCLRMEPSASPYMNSRQTTCEAFTAVMELGIRKSKKKRRIRKTKKLWSRGTESKCGDNVSDLYSKTYELDSETLYGLYVNKEKLFGSAPDVINSVRM